jgi:hypothetical protein
MPVKQHVEVPPLSAAWRWTLMTGTRPTARLAGWVEQAQETTEGTVAGDRLWAIHGEALTAEARAAGFTPYWVAQQAPAGRDFRQWRDRFLAEHAY